MSSQYPSGDRDKRGVRQKLKSGAKWLKNVVGRPSNVRPSSENPEDLTIPNLGSRSLSISRPSTPLLAPTVAPIEPDPRIEVGPDAEASNTTAREPKKPDSVAWNRLANSLRILESGVQIFPPLKSAIGALIGCLDIVQKAVSSRAEYDDLADEFRSMADLLSQYAGELELEPSNGSIANIAQCIKHQAEEIGQKQASGSLGHLSDASEEQEDVIRRYRQMERLFRQLQCDLSLRTRSDVKKQLETTLLRGMLPVDDAKYNSSYSTTIRRRACTAETREAIHQTLKNWTTNLESEKIYWMNGMAGTGKTTIAYSYCGWLEETNRLGASFFCSRISATCRSLSQIVPTIAYRLAHFSPAFRSKLCAALKDDPDAGKLNVGQQFEKLINEPILQAKGAIPDGVVIVIDALDECDDNYSVRLLLDLLLKFTDQLPLKFFVSSRPEPVIRERMMSRGGAARSIVYLHDIEESIVVEDIKKYLTEALGDMAPPPSPTQIDLLARRARNLFIYAATVVRYIHPQVVHVDSGARLEAMLVAISDRKAIAENKYDDLDRLYTTVLSAAFNEHLDNGERQRMERVLWIVVCAREPITGATIALLSDLNERQVWAALQSLRSVVHVPEDNSLISTLHASFPEYMLDGTRSKKFQCDESKSNEAIVHRCFGVMRSELKFNICALENSYLTDDQVDGLKERVSQYISPSLSYACRYWGSHLSLAPAVDITHDMVLDFLSNRLLYWMEVLSLSGCIGIGALLVQQAQTWLRVESDQDEIQKQVSDARNFVTWFAANPCSRSTPHIYASALPVCAKSSWVYQHYIQRTNALPNISVRHDEAVLAIWSVKSPVLSLSISPDGHRLATGSEDGSIHVYDIHTGAVIAGPFKGHTNQVESVAFSPSGTHIASGSDDETIIVWDALTGRVMTGPLHEHTKFVMSVGFSPDGTRIVSGSGDRCIIVWDSSTGAIILGPLRGHTYYIFSASFSPDGRLIASCSYDRSVRLWDAHTGAALAELKGHQDRVTQIAFSPDGTRLASCSSDNTIRLWDVATRASVGKPLRGHEGGIWSIAYSADGSHIASGGDQAGGIIVWKVLTGLPVFDLLSGHSSGVNSVSFSSDNSRVISCSTDRTIRVWDINLQSRKGASSPQNAREMSVGPIAFLSNHTQFVSSSSSGVLRGWDLHTGRTIPREFEGQTGLEIIAISSHSTLVAASTSDRAVRVWDADTGKSVSRPLIGHSDSVKCLDFSPDGFYLCSGSADGKIIVWNVQASARVGQPYKGHTGAVRSVAYSSDGTRIASGGTDCTVMIWGTSTGKLIHTLNGHEGSVSFVTFLSDGTYIISRSIDGVVRKWEVPTGSCTSTLFEPGIHYSDHINTNEPGQSIFVNCICVSSDGTRIVIGFGSSLGMVDSHTMKPITELHLPENEIVQWVGFSPNGTDIISVSTDPSTAGLEKTSGTFAQKKTQRPSIIRVWRAGVGSDQSGSHGWSCEPDGRVLSPEGLLIWVPPDLFPLLNVQSDCYFNPLVMTADGVIDLGYDNPCIGSRWAECYITEDSVS